VIGFRTGTPKLALAKRGGNWNAALECVKAFLPAFIRNKPEIDKEALIAQRDDEPVKWALPQCGLKVTQGESFYIEPHLEQVAEKVQEVARG
jgi:phage host-nuclease inhibitor protein Gam